MSLIGAISLTNNQGLFLGSVNLDNLNVGANQLLFSENGVDISGLNLGAGLDISGSDLQTIGNPAIQLVSNSLYVNDNVGSTPIQTAIDNATQSDVLYISSGSYGEPQVSINSKYNIALSGPPTGQYSSTICEIVNGFTIKGTSEQIRFSNLQIKGSNSLSGVGRYKFQGVVFSGSSGSPCSITVNNLTQFIVFFNCEFDQYCTVNISSGFASACYFINCGFNNAVINLNNTSPLQVIFNNCSGFSSFPASNKATFVGLNVLANGLSNTTTTQINGVAPVSIASQANTRIPIETSTTNALTSSANLTFNTSTNTLSVPTANITDISGVSTINGSSYSPLVLDNQYLEAIPFCTGTPNHLDIDALFQYNPLTATLFLLGYNSKIYVSRIENLKNIIFESGLNTLDSTNECVTTDGVNGFKLTPVGGEFSNYNIYYYSGQQTVKSGASITLFSMGGSIGGRLPEFPIMYSGVFNFSITSNSCILTILLTDDGGTTATYTQALTNNGHHQININMLTNFSEYTNNTVITASVDNGTISTDVNDYYSIQAYNVKNFATGVPI